jgi:hypothetical protein
MIRIQRALYRIRHRDGHADGFVVPESDIANHCRHRNRHCRSYRPFGTEGLRERSLNQRRRRRKYQMARERSPARFLRDFHAPGHSFGLRQRENLARGRMIPPQQIRSDPLRFVEPRGRNVRSESGRPRPASHDVHYSFTGRNPLRRHDRLSADASHRRSGK